MALLALLAAALPAAAQVAAPAPVEVLFVTNQATRQEAVIDVHLAQFDRYNVTHLRDSQLTSRVSLSRYDLIILSELSPAIPTSGIDSLKRSRKPILVHSHGSFSLAYKLGLVRSKTAALVSTDVIDSTVAAITPVSRLAGDHVLVHQPYNTVYGIARSQLVSSAAPLYYSSRTRNEIAVIHDPTRRMAATGVSNTTSYTTDAWQLFDVLIDQVIGDRGTWRDTEDVVAAYVHSGLADYLARVAKEVARKPGSWNPDIVKQETWRVFVDWELTQLGEMLSYQLTAIFPGVHLLPPEFWAPSYSQPTYGTGDDSRWFLGQDAAGNVLAWDPYITGTDLGASAQIWGRTYFYMGDTTGQMSANNCAAGAVCNDAIARLYTGDTVPSDGIKAIPLVEWNGGAWKTRPQIIPEVHTVPWNASYWVPAVAGENPEPPFTVPGGAVTTARVYQVLVDGIWRGFSVPTIMLWYATASNPAQIVTSNTRKTPRSWAVCSLDGFTFTNCYGAGTPFSEETATHPARFVNVAAVNVYYTDLIAMCGASGYDTDNPLCDPAIYDAGPTMGGTLLFGAGHLYRQSGLYIAFVRHDEIGDVNADGTPLVRYLKRNASSALVWTTLEAEATRMLPLTSTQLDNCDNDTSRTTCAFRILLNPSLAPDVFGELSVKMIRDGVAASSPPKLVMLSNPWFNPLASAWLTTETRYRSTDLAHFWSWSTSAAISAEGYGPYIIDRFTSYSGLGSGTLTLYFTSSKWNGQTTSSGIPYPDYGVYTDSLAVTPWPG